MDNDDNIVKGRGAQKQVANVFQKHQLDRSIVLGVDEYDDGSSKTRFLNEQAKTLVNKVSSPDIPLDYSMNPYQGCEHGCVYCYARETHKYWGYNAGLDFEQVVMVKQNAPELFLRFLNKRNYVPKPIMLSGNTDCYQPGEKRYKLTRKLLEIALEYKQPIGIITKNALITRDIDILQEMAKENLIRVAISYTTLNEALRRKLEPRTSTGQQRLNTMESLSKAGIPVTAMIAPIIPGLNQIEVPILLKTAAEHGAKDASYTIVRLNGEVEEIFKDWILRQFPEKANRVLAQIAECRGGGVGERRIGKRMKGEGVLADVIARMFEVYKKKYFNSNYKFAYNTDAFIPLKKRQLSLFG